MTLPKGYKPSGEKVKSYKDRLKLIAQIAMIAGIFAVGSLLNWLLNT
jgi:mannose/fructose/N-acetylgalactosamine-specific phosphotransferase system component IID